MIRGIMFALAASIVMAALSDGANAIRKTVLTVDQDGQVNAAGVATIADVATNAVKAQVASAAADAAQATARSVTNALNGIVQNIMLNNTVIYRYGYVDSFSALVIIGEDDKVVISHFAPVRNGTTLTATIRYVCTVDIGTVKPTVYANDNLSGGRDNFGIVPDENVVGPTFHAGTVVIGEGENAETYSGYYEITATVPDVSGNSYFFWIKIDPDVPSGDGTSLELPNGVVGGVTETVQFGSRALTFRKGMLVGVE